MPDKVATITGLRGMFRYVGGAFGISVITIILHLSATTARGFRATFFAFGLGLLLTIPLVFLMPAGRQQWRPDAQGGGIGTRADLRRGGPSGP
jgi:sugar phosphate permease